MSSKPESERTTIYLHIPKTGGMSLDRVLARNYEPVTVYDMYGELDEATRKLLAVPVEQRARIRLLKGHIPFGVHVHLPLPCVYFTLLRRPVDRIVSLYHFAQQTPGHHLYRPIRVEGMSLLELVDAHITAEFDNQLIRDLANRRDIQIGECTREVLELAQENVERYFTVVGLMERFDETVHLLAQAHGWRSWLGAEVVNATANRGSRKPLDRAVLQHIQELNALDLEFYEWAVQRFERQMRQPRFWLPYRGRQWLQRGRQLIPFKLRPDPFRQVQGAAQPALPGIAPTRGVVHDAYISGGHLYASGWIAAPDDLVEGIRLACGAEELQTVNLKLGLPSPNVAKALPSWKDSGRSGFNLTAPMTMEQQSRLMQALVQITPVAGGRTGRMMILPMQHAPVLPLPAAGPGQVAVPDVLETAGQLVAQALQRGGLGVRAKVLDLGCGPGTLAYRLAYYLADGSGYQGLDAHPWAIEWAQQTLTPLFPCFEFRTFDLRNRWYNPDGTVDELACELPYSDAKFDFVFAADLFMHVQPMAAFRMLQQIRRVLRPGGCCLIQGYLVDDEWRAALLQSRAAFPFVPHAEGCYTVDRDLPETLVAFEESDFMERARRSGLALVSKEPGAWIGRPPLLCLRHEDVLIFECEAPEPFAQRPERLAVDEN
jgi:SAM-dependent methyltransferase